uniref:Uncharacterized protein n=1 Tax=Ananas comosus var. bracteatus TaxID=296719 RepID=A0A6V7NUI7_ANACO|nr:unnamed protein product [Ananas comosus var. bracteatus]
MSDGGYAVKSVVGEELEWYVSPEEAAGGRALVLRVRFSGGKDQSHVKFEAAGASREVLLKLPKVASFCLLLLHPHPNSRPKISEVLLSDLLNEPRERLQECETAIKVKEEIDEKELLLEFLLQLQQRKQEAADKLRDTICLLSSDLEEVAVHQSITKKCGSLFEKSIEDELLAAEKVEKPLLLPASQKAGRSELYSSVEKLDEAELKQGDLLNSSNLVCALGFNRDRELFATANVNRKIKIFECDMVLNQKLDIHYPVVEMTSRSKLSSICWNSYIRVRLLRVTLKVLSRYGMLQKNQIYAEMGEHERRVWSIDISKLDPTMLASGCDDGTVKIWNMNQAIPFLHLQCHPHKLDSLMAGREQLYNQTTANVCSVQFSPDSSHFLAIGSADHRVYCYDRRNIRLLKTVGLVYVYFEGDRQLIADFHRPYKFEEFCWLVDFEWIHCNRLRNK